MAKTYSHKIPLLGTLFSLVLIILFSHLIWKSLLRKEAISYGELFIKNLFVSVSQINQDVKKSISPALYKQLHQKPLAQSSANIISELKKLDQKLKDTTHIPQMFFGLYTDCEATKSAQCYWDSDPIKKANFSYNPKSRPWYLASQAISDWVMINFMRLRATRRSGYPTSWGWALSKRLILPDESLQPDHNKGLWVNLYIPESSNKINLKDKFNPPPDPLINLGLPHKENLFIYFQVRFRTLRFGKDYLNQTKPLNIECHENNEYVPFSLTYRAVVPCRVNGEFILFDFSKNYDQIWHVVILFFLAILLLYIAYGFFAWLNRLQNQNILHKIEIEKVKSANLIGTKLIHDLKKGIMAQLNRLPHEYANDFDTEALQSDFKPRLKQNLDFHFKHLNLLNKYIQLLTNNLKRQQEKSWKPFDETLVRDYLSWILGETELKINYSNAADKALSLIIKQDIKIDVKLTVSKDLLGFYVPEMAFFRVIKNLWENFNAYGTGNFHIEITKSNGSMIFKSSNSVKEISEHTQSSTQLGMIIIKQLMEDNFGLELIHVESHKEDKEFWVLIKFPYLTSIPNQGA